MGPRPPILYLLNDFLMHCALTLRLAIRASASRAADHGLHPPPHHHGQGGRAHRRPSGTACPPAPQPTALSVV